MALTQMSGFPALISSSISPTFSKSWTVGLAHLCASASGSTVTLTLQGEAGKTYSILSNGVFPPPSWTKFTNVPARSTNGPIQVVVPAAGSARFYRLVSPAQP